MKVVPKHEVSVQLLIHLSRSDKTDACKFKISSTFEKIIERSFGFKSPSVCIGNKKS